MLGVFRLGAVDYLLKPVSQDELMRKFGAIDQHLKLQDEASRLRQIVNQQQKMDVGVFTTLLVDALSGSAANPTGSISPGSVYAQIDQCLGGWEQRAIFKTNVQEFISLRDTSAAKKRYRSNPLAKLQPRPTRDSQRCETRELLK